MLLRRPLRITTLKHYDREANLFFSGFLPETTLTEVEQFFSKYGTIVSVQFSYDDSKRSRGYGWV
jgi:polyadenylate-binding protein